jgi:phosphate/sulfate permease
MHASPGFCRSAHFTSSNSSLCVSLPTLQTGANDVANAFGTSVGAKTITLRQAVVIAALFEFTGAIVLGRVSTSTIAAGIADITAFQREPEFYAYGMVCALTVSGVWQVLSSYWELNTSSTHSIIGSIIGFSFVYGGSDAVKWSTPDPKAFPPYRGVVPIVVSWFFSPILTASSAALIMFLLRTLVLRRKKAYILSFWVLPPAVLLTVFICVFFVFTRGAKKTLESSASWTEEKSLWVAAVVAACTAVFTAAVLVPLLYWYSQRKFRQQDEEEAARAKEDLENQAEEGKEEKLKSPVAEGQEVVPVSPIPLDRQNSSKRNFVVPVVAKDQAGPSASLASPRSGPAPVAEAREDEEAASAAGSASGKSKASLLWSRTMSKGKELFNKIDGTQMDIHAVIEEDPIVNAIHRNAEVFDPKAESVFRYLQVFSAICVIFSHGAGEVGYMAGPLATIWDVVTKGKLSSKVEAELWPIFLGAIALVIGLATYGYNVTRAMGVKVSKLSPSRGFAAELATAMVIMIAAQYGLPTSSSQCITGGIIGCGLLEGTAGVNWRFFVVQFISWIATLFVVALGTGALFAAGAYAPSVNCGNDVVVYEDYLVASHNRALRELNDTITAMMDAARYTGAEAPLFKRIGAPNEAWLLTLRRQINWAVSNVTLMSNTRGQTTSPYDLTDYHARAMRLVQNHTMITLGQNTVFQGALNECNDFSRANLIAGNATHAASSCRPIRLVPSGYPTTGIKGQSW